MSYPILYPSAETEFNSNGIGVLSDCISCVVTEERNGQFEFQMKYPVDGIHYDDLVDRAIILAKPNPIDQEQPFRIYRSTKPINGICTFYARHISYDLSGIPVSPFSASSVVEALENLKSSAAVPCPFTFNTDKITSANMNVKTPASIYYLLAGNAGGVLDVYGGEYKFDRFNVWLYNHRGTDRGVNIRYGKNLLDLEQERNCSNVYTGVYPYWADTEENLVQLPEKIVNAPGTYDHTRIMTLDLSSEWENAPTVDQLRTRAQSYMGQNNIGVPTVSLTVTHAMLEQTEEYKGMSLLERVDLCDTAQIEFPKLGVSASAQAIATVYNVLSERYESIKFGSARTSFVDTIDEQSVELEQSKNKASSLVAEAMKKLNEIVQNSSGLYTTEEVQPDRSTIYYYHDKPTLNESKNVIKFTADAIGLSTDGGKSYPFGFTVTGDMVANILSAIGVNANWINAGILQSMPDENGERNFTFDLQSGEATVKNLSIHGQTVDDIAQGKADGALESAKGYADSAVNNFVSSVYDPRIAELQKQLDGQIESFYRDYEPSLDNYPANEWVSDTDKQKHEGDLFYWKSKGYAYRFFKDGNTWKWQLVQDTDVTKALAEAANAQHTADGKSRTFISEPVPPYDEGDQWYRGIDNSALVCTNSRQSGAFDMSDWAKLDNYADGKETIYSIQAQYYLSTSETSLIGGNWSDSQPEWTQGKYIWNRQYVTYGDGHHAYMPSEDGVCITGNTGAAGKDGAPGAPGAPGKDGAPGAKGDDGRGIKSTSITYKKSNSGTVAPSGTWENAIPAVSAGEYLWTKIVYTYTDSTTDTAYSVSMMGQTGLRGLQGQKGDQGLPGPKGDRGDAGPAGPQGAAGAQGPKGDSGQTSYFHIKYSAVANPTTSSQMTETPSEYIGTYVDFTEADSNEPGKYKWSRFQGLQGAKGTQGIPGTNGTNGQTSYLHIKYSNDGGATFTSNSGETVGDYIGQLVNFTQADSTNPKDYTWSKIKGDKGDAGAPGAPGKDGVNGANGTNAYTHIRYSASSDGSNFVAAPTAATIYIGVYTGTSATAPTDKASYIWSKYKGDKGDKGEAGSTGATGPRGPKGDTGAKGATGNGINSITYYYAVTTTQTPPAASAVTSTTIPALSATNKYLWQKEVIDFTDASVADKTTVILLAVYGDRGATGAKGDKGAAGTSVTIASTSITYQASNSGTTAPTGNWSGTVPSVANGQYLWTKTVVTYSDGKSTTAYAVAYKGTNGKDGAKGATGNGIKSVEAEYYTSTSATTPTGGSWSTSIPTVQKGKYIWTRQKITYSDGSVAYAGQYCMTKTVGDIAQQKVDAQTQSDIFNKLTNNGALQGLFMQDGQLYINGQYLRVSDLAATGAKIGNWIIDSNKIYGGAKETGGYTVIGEPWGNYYVFAAGSPDVNDPSNALFRVHRNGNLYATGAEISGNVTVTGGSIDALNVKIAGKYGGLIQGTGMVASGAVTTGIVLYGPNGVGGDGRPVPPYIIVTTAGIRLQDTAGTDLNMSAGLAEVNGALEVRAAAGKSGGVNAAGTIHSGTQLYSDRDVVAVGNMYAADYLRTSDRRLKKDIEPLGDAYARALDGMTPVRYRYKTDPADGPYRLGYIAQDVRAAMEAAGIEDAGMVGEYADGDGNARLALAYDELIALLHMKINSLEAEINELREEINGNTRA